MKTSYDHARHSGVNYRGIKRFLEAADRHDGHIRMEATGFEPLVVENLEYRDHKGRPVYSMAHYYTQNGDAMRDPDMTFSVDEAGQYIVPLTYQLDSLGIYQEVFCRNQQDQLMYSRRLLVDLDEFLWHWLQNIQMQGFEPPQ